MEITEKTGLKLPRKVITLDYGDYVGDLYIRFKHARDTEGEPTDDGQVIVHYDENQTVAGIEILDITTL